MKRVIIGHCCSLLWACSSISRTTAFPVRPAVLSRQQQHPQHVIIESCHSLPPIQPKPIIVNNPLRLRESKSPPSPPTNGVFTKLWKSFQNLFQGSHFAAWLPLGREEKTASQQGSTKEDQLITKEEESTTTTASDQETQTFTTTTSPPQGPRWAVAYTDLSGTWKPIITPAFKKKYEEYLQHCGEGLLFRKTLLAAIGIGREVYKQCQDGRQLFITGTTPVAKWERVLVASGADHDTADYETVATSFRDPDGDSVEVEAWWEEEGTVHRSMLRGKPRVEGGVFESKRYLLPQNDNILVCESIFHPPANHSSSKFQPDSVEWRFQRVE